MSDLPSINNLLKKKKTADDSFVLDSTQKLVGHIDLHISSPEIEEKFKKKMGQVAIKEREEETINYAASLGLPHIDLEKFPISQESLRQIPLDEATRLGTICFFSTPDEFRLGTTKPENEEVKELVQHLEEKRHADSALYVISQNSLDRVLKLYANLPKVEAITKDISVNENDLKKVQADITDLSSLQKLFDKQSTTDLIVLLLGAALKLEASDLHVEAEENKIMVRVRLDGILHDAAILDKEIYTKLVSRVKLFSSLKINVFDKPQDGRFTIKLTKGAVDVRVSTIPTVYGESIVMRLLDQFRHGLDLSRLGFYGDAEEKLRHEITRPNGMIVITGPTGAGKTTTLYAILDTLNKPGVKIITLEDPVEYQIGGVNQVQINPAAGLTFASGMRSFLRQDPNIIMVGEIRDKETTELAVQAALTGHLVFSTLHTNDAPGAIPRLLDLKAEPFLLASAMTCILAQRVLRKVCEHCKEAYDPPVEVAEDIKKVLGELYKNDKPMKLYRGKKCPECNNSGYIGRVGIFEVLPVSEKIARLCLERADAGAIEKEALIEGMITMKQDGYLKAIEGVTSIEEVLRVAQE